MSTPSENRLHLGQPSLSTLLARFLQQRVEARALGLAASETGGEVMPFEAVPVPTVDPRLAWSEARAVARFYSLAEESRFWPVPPDWPALVLAQEPVAAPAFALANFPQLVRHVQPLVQTTDLNLLRPSGGKPLGMVGLATWAAQTACLKDSPLLLLALACLRLARQFDQAETLLASHRAAIPAAWQPALANEEAALAWHQGHAEQALQMWHNQADSVPVWFNRGLALLFLGQPAEACRPLSQAIAQLNENSAWHHLGRLYLALAQGRR